MYSWLDPPFSYVANGNQNALSTGSKCHYYEVKDLKYLLLVGCYTLVRIRNFSAYPLWFLYKDYLRISLSTKFFIKIAN
jgi:hypothetical protein